MPAVDLPAFVPYVLVGLATGYGALAVESVYLHRGLTHGGLEFSRAGHLAGRTATWMMIGTTPQKWVAVHRMHHRHSDTAEDPHSPHYAGLGHILVASAVYYARAASTPEELQRYARGCEPDDLDRRLFRFGGAGLLVFYLGVAAAFGWGPGAVVLLAHAALYYVVQGFLNGLCHWSFREERRPATVNRPFFALLTVLFMVRREQGRLSELDGLIQESVDGYPDALGLRPLVALLHAELGRDDDARREMEAFERAGFATVSRDQVWASCAVVSAELCLRLGMPGLAEQILPAVEPLGARLAYNGLVALGSLEW
ncbi:MAG TPA: fatty acid desaturase, partial [Acidimicrobiales bacterium]|nr:fatty acid desaturase [Acidimicrobiales bacterium]